MSDVTPEGAQLPDEGSEPPRQAAPQEPLDDYPEIELTLFDSHRTSLPGDDEDASTTLDPDDMPPMPPLMDA